MSVAAQMVSGQRAMMAAAAELELRRRAYRTDIFGYMQNRLKIKREHLFWSELPGYENHKWSGDKDPLAKMCQAVQDGKWIGVQSATNVGKTYTAAAIATWFFDCFDDALVITVAPKQDQLDLNIWKEIYKFSEVWHAGKVQTREIRKGDAWVMVGFVAGTRAMEDVTTRAQGFHSEHMLIVFEEMPGINPALVSAFEITSGGSHNICVGLGNPDHQFDGLVTFCKQSHVTPIRISAFDFPNIVLGCEVIPGAQTRVGLERLKNKLGEGSQLFKSRADGRTPTQSRDALIQADWCYDAVRRGQEIEWTDEFRAGKRKALGVDAARSDDGDKAAIARGYGEHCYEVVDFQCPDPNKLGDDLAVEIATDKIDPQYVGVDVVGPGGETVGTLKGKGYYVQGLGGGDAPVENYGDDVYFENLRCQMYWQAREDLRRGLVTIPNDPELIEDLTTPLNQTDGKKIKVESKKDFKKRLGRSPNKGDAFVYWNWVRQNINLFFVVTS